jgi:hypothetical protein
MRKFIISALAAASLIGAGASVANAQVHGGRSGSVHQSDRSRGGHGWHCRDLQCILDKLGQLQQGSNTN